MTATKKAAAPQLPLEAPVAGSAVAVQTPVAQRAAALSVPENGAGSITDLLRLAVEKGTPVAELKELVALHEQMDKRQAQRDFFQAMAAFQQECPSIKKAATAKIATKGGGQYSYTYAELDDIARTVNPILWKHGLSYAWNSSVEKGQLTCVCTVRHVNGHSESSSFTLPTETASAMSAQQAVGAALTFAQRRSLSAALGLTTTDQDSDANTMDPTPISDDQFVVLEDLITETKVNRARFLKYLDVEELEKLPAARFQQALTALQQKKERAQ